MGKKNVRQIGQIQGARRIYIEDYAMTYLRQLAEERGVSGSGRAVLVGAREQEEEKENFYIYGVLELPMQEGTVGASEEEWMGDGVWSSVYARMREYFPDREILGWYLAAEGREVEQDERIIRFHKNNFGGKNQFFFHCDPGNLEETVYFYEEGRMKRQNGYYIFYEKNEEMQGLLVEKRQRESGVKLERTGESGREKERVVEEIRRTLEEKKEVRVPLQTKNGWTSYLAGAVTAVAALAICLMVLGYFDRLHSLEETVRQMEETLLHMPADQQEEMLPDIAQKQTGGKGSVLEIETLTGGVEKIREKSEGAQEQEKRQEPESLQETEKDAVSEEKMPEEPETEKEEEKPAVEETVAPAWTNYVVRPGDTLSAICQQHYHNVHMVDRVMEANGLADPNEILAGDVLILPGS